MKITKEYLEFCSQYNKAYKKLDSLNHLPASEAEEISDLILNARIEDFPAIFKRLKGYKLARSN